MQISHVTIRNILGVTELEFDAGSFNAITGPNGTGKTSVLEAVKATTQCGHDATLLRKGATEGEVVLVLDDGSSIHRRVTAAATKTDLIRDGKKTARPTDAIKALTDALAVNPVDFLRAPDKDRTRVLLESMPLEVDTERLAEISGIDVDADPAIHGLQVIETVRRQVYDDRTGTNRAVREKDATINQLRAALPPAPEGVEGDEASLQARIDEAQNAYQAEADRIAAKLAGIVAQSNTAMKSAAAEVQAKIDAIRHEHQQAEEAERRRLAGIEATETRDGIVDPLKRAKAVIAANREAAAARQTTLATIATLTTELADLQSDAEQQSKALTDIEAYKLELLSSLPIPGLAVIDGVIERDGVPFDRLNTAQQVDIAVEIAKLRAGSLGVICVDGIELLDTKAFEAFRTRCLESGLQLFVSRVSDADFSIEVDD